MKVAFETSTMNTQATANQRSGTDTSESRFRHHPYGPHSPRIFKSSASTESSNRNSAGEPKLAVRLDLHSQTTHGKDMAGLQPQQQTQLCDCHVPMGSGSCEKPAAAAVERPKKPWEPIEASWLPRCHAMTAFPPGFKVKVYDGRFTNYFEVPSEWIVPTHGGLKYVEHFNERGPYSKFRFQLCNNYLNGRCTKGFNCTYVHAMRLPPAHVIHVQGLDGYERLPPGLTLFVHLPGSTAQPQMIQSQFIIRTDGAERLYADVIENNLGACVRPQHCAHFLYKKLCNLGAECAFIHVMPHPASALDVIAPA